MVGILCSSGKDRVYSRYFQLIFSSSIQRNDISFVFFSISKIDFSRNSLKGYILSAGSNVKSEVSIPPLILNFSEQYRRSDIKKLRRLTEMDSITIMNQANHLNQYTIIQMISSCYLCRNYTLPFKLCSSSYCEINMHADCNIIAIPNSSPKISKSIYLKGFGSCYEVVHGGCSRRVGETEIQSEISMLMRKKGWLFIEAPDLIMNDGSICVVRIYLQRGADGEWQALYEKDGSLPAEVRDSCMNLLRKLSVYTSKYISCFMPGFGNFYMDYVFDLNYHPYYLSFGSWKHELLNIIYEDCLGFRKEGIYKMFHDNLLGYCRHSADNEKEGRDGRVG